uniref:Epoxide hydrolase n=1 Tax=Lepisosteus oculatus TaxID=7918 RepID=W5NG22_LEPOC
CSVLKKMDDSLLSMSVALGTMLLEVAAAVALGVVVCLLVFRKKKVEETLEAEDGWWGAGQRPESAEDETIRPFRVQTSTEEIQDLYRRIDQTRPVPSLEESRFHYGFNSTYLQKVVSYWRNEFDWEKQVAKLNKYPHFKTKIDGLDIHFIHVRPPHLPEGKTAIPLLMVHGWPSSFFEFYGILPLLTEPANPDDIVFQVICPSIPGYGFSEAPHKQGFDSVCAAHIFYKLMKRLGFNEFYAQGGDWGCLICTNIAQLQPSRVKGLHLSFLSVANPGLIAGLSLLFGQRFPGLFELKDHDVKRLFPFMKKVVVELLKESGYLHIQATKPDTAGRALNDSPVGLAVYILEKFSTWTDPEFRNLEDGGLERKYSIDDLLTNVMIYWVTGSIISSMRLYKEILGRGVGTQKHDKVPVRVPTAVACFPNELVHLPKIWAKQKYPNVVSFNYLPRGGHFGAFEEPELLAADIQSFVKK